ncbi:hypothetical protein F7018_00970 [Tenacibaculum aiptasiae]|uniref:Uncharacterized protein n=1 Tax=Tenacibaculum aiptasiae TaxID=426481 RepID=A0A7J5ASE1_9FLAO|nr:hypothetical protein [Tenacibaculum aiptasiae]KAB1160479.1 hypothetical protein F7018_00970 [Tenacibaculum aiptasiae]
MKTLIFYIIVGLLFLLIPLSGIGILGTMITDKYQIQHARTFLEIDSNKLSEIEIREKSKAIGNLEKTIKQKQLLMFGIATIGLVSGISLLRNKNSLLNPITNHTKKPYNELRKSQD